MSLGQPLKVLPGDPGTVRALAAALADQAELCTGLARTVRGLGDPGTQWEGAAASAFQERAGEVAHVLERLSRRYAVSASALGAFASRLEECQAEVAAAQALHDEAEPKFLRAGNDMGDPAKQAWAAQSRADMVRWGELDRLAQAQYQQAWQDFEHADRACAAVLRGLLDDGLADSWRYDALTGLGSFSQAVADNADALSLIPVLAGPATVVSKAAAATSVGTQVTVKLTYGDGSWGSIGRDAALNAAGASGEALKLGAKATVAEEMAAAGSRQQRRRMRLGLAKRWRIGMLEQLSHPLADLGKKPAVQVIGRVPPRGIGATKAWALERVVVHKNAYLANRWLADLAEVNATAGGSMASFTAGVVLDEGSRVVGQTTSTSFAPDRPDRPDRPVRDHGAGEAQVPDRFRVQQVRDERRVSHPPGGPA